jgi:hypothetical protein
MLVHDEFALPRQLYTAIAWACSAASGVSCSRMTVYGDLRQTFIVSIRVALKLCIVRGFLTGKWLAVELTICRYAIRIDGL